MERRKPETCIKAGELMDEYEQAGTLNQKENAVIVGSLRFWMGRWCNVDGTKMKELQEQAVSLSEAREAARKTDGMK
ncbi:hypothetical protein EMCRGX_G018047 [Ephydatia muelleri]